MTEASANSTKNDKQHRAAVTSMKTPVVTSNGDAGSGFDYLKNKSFDIFTEEDYQKVEVSYPCDM